MSITRTNSREQLEERLAALHQASLELVQDISAETLYQRIINTAREQVGATYAAVGLRGDDGEISQFVSSEGDPSQSAQNSLLPMEQGLIGVIARAEGAIRVDYTHKSLQKSKKQGGQPSTTSWLGIPIRYGAQELGQIYLANKTDETPFTSDDEQVMETLAAYAAIAISNARSYQDLRQRDRTLTRRNQDLALLNSLASTLASIAELDELLGTALERVINYFHAAIGEIYLSEENHHSLHQTLHLGELDKTIWIGERLTHKDSLVGKTIRTGQPLVVNLPHEEDRYLNSKELLDKGIHQIACFPLTSRSTVLGVISIALNNQTALDSMDQQLLSSIASWVGTTIENVRLNIQGRRLAVLEERERIGMDLHDGIIQSIYAVGLTLEHARLLLDEEPGQVRQRINQSIQDLNSTIRDLRAFIMDMRPRKLYEEDLMDGLQRLVREFRANSLVRTDFSGPPNGIDKLPDTHAIALFHICQEALANIAKHAQAETVEVKVWTTPDRVSLEIKDDGRGFNSTRVKYTLGHGISNMQTRAHNVGGDLEISAEPGIGTRITAWVPSKQYTEPDELE